MTENVQVSLADWDYLAETWRETGSPSFYFDALADKDDWVDPSQSLIISDWEHAQAVARAYDAIRGSLPKASRARFDRFCSAFFWGERRHRDLDLPDADEFFTLLAPESVSEYLELWRTLDVKELREPFQSQFPPGQPHDPHLKTFDKSVRRFIEQWGDILDEADDQGRGIVTFIA